MNSGENVGLPVDWTTINDISLSDMIADTIDSAIIQDNFPHDDDLEALLNSIAESCRINTEAVATHEEELAGIESCTTITEVELEIVPTEPVKIQCATCDTIFDEGDFELHVCEYDENRQLIDDGGHVLTFEQKTMKLLMFNENMMQNFLREQCKMFIPKERSKRGPFDCQLCNRQFVYESGLVRHMEKHKVDDQPKRETVVKMVYSVVKCMHCGEVFSTLNYATEHFNEVHADFELPADDEYLAAIIASSILQCEFCDCVFTQFSDLIHHSSLHCPTKSFSCNLCTVAFPRLKQLHAHWQTECIFMEFEPGRHINLMKFFACNVCQEFFSTHQELNDHRISTLHFFPRKNHQNGRLQVNCGSCDMLFASVDTLMAHHNGVHVKKVSTIRKAAPQTSAKPRLHLCDICGKSYTQSSHLHQHLRFHQGVKPFECPEEGCGRKFTIRPDLNDHIRKCHTGERPYHCLLCGKRFLTGSVYYQHRLIHRGERRYACDQCDKKFYRADALKNHLRIHSGEKPYPCPHCSKKFRQRGDREKHVRARHRFLPPPNSIQGILPPDLEAPERKKRKYLRKLPSPPPQNVAVPVQRLTRIKLPMIDPRKIQF